MCGIVGCIGADVYPILIKGLHRLEYRGYDSAGVAIVNSQGDINIYKSKGKVDALDQFCQGKDLEGAIGIAHTRWATHGDPTDRNAHPHVSADGTIAMVHNGTIENYAVLKEALIEQGVEFTSDTDTEVLVQLIAYIRSSAGCSLINAVAEALRQVVGAYAIAVVDSKTPDTMIVARKSSPLVIGLGDEATFIASDASPIVDYTDRVIYLDDDQLAVIRMHQTPEVINLNDLSPADVDVHTLRMSVAQLEKGGYDHFMLKEIFEQPTTLRDCIRGRITTDHRVTLSGVNDNAATFIKARRIVFVACGTSWHASLIGRRLMQEIARVPAEVEYASEFRYSNPIIGSGDVVVAVSQSGETADTLAACQLARERGAMVYGICNVVGSSIARNTDSGTYIHVGPEIGVASTKAFTGQVTVMAMLAIAIGQLRHTVTDGQVSRLASDIVALPSLVAETLKLNDEIERLSATYTYVHNFLYLGRGYNYPTALEGALKLKEISYIHAEGYPAAEIKHGPIALIDHEMPTVFIAPDDEMHEKIVSNIRQVKARGGSVIALVTEGDESISQLADHVLRLPKVTEPLSPIVASIPLQLLAYHVAVKKGCDVDMPRNLAKSVTVE